MPEDDDAESLQRHQDDLFEALRILNPFIDIIFDGFFSDFFSISNFG
jgi:hypothetical protein